MRKSQFENPKKEMKNQETISSTNKEKKLKTKCKDSDTNYPFICKKTKLLSVKTYTITAVKAEQLATNCVHIYFKRHNILAKFEDKTLF